MIYYLLLINIATFLVFAIDKRRAVKRKWRIPEKTLLGFSLIGGSIGGLIAMHLFRHKIRKPVFAYGLPVMLLVQVIVILAVGMVFMP
jgi:uncharacterized membrane protein YsdA (DUF1294 family)